MEITASRVSVSLAILIAIFCSAQADYIAFPRMGRSSRSANQNNEENSATPGRRKTRQHVSLPRRFILPRKRSPWEHTGDFFTNIERRQDLPWNFIVPRKKALPQGFILPRKRGYIAFPRMGRSHVKAETAAGCCGVGLKEEFVLGSDGKEELRSVCSIVNGDCCVGLREIVDEKPDGVYYSMCVPDIPSVPKSMYRWRK